mmetsp:Transcript_85885/g.221059  ORF Transcript_85885/g.221059 Transcript_85885/m.221059 type:complete len:275 (+) Transcript_85885:1153-1977(+)
MTHGRVTDSAPFTARRTLDGPPEKDGCEGEGSKVSTTTRKVRSAIQTRGVTRSVAASKPPRSGLMRARLRQRSSNDGSPRWRTKPSKRYSKPMNGRVRPTYTAIPTAPNRQRAPMAGATSAASPSLPVGVPRGENGPGSRLCGRLPLRGLIGRSAWCERLVGGALRGVRSDERAESNPSGRFPGLLESKSTFGSIAAFFCSSILMASGLRRSNSSDLVFPPTSPSASSTTAFAASTWPSEVARPTAAPPHAKWSSPGASLAPPERLWKDLPGDI